MGFVRRIIRSITRQPAQVVVQQPAQTQPATVVHQHLQMQKLLLLWRQVKQVVTVDKQL